MTARTNLVDRARSGDREAFGELFATHQHLIHQFVYRRTGDRALTEDLTSETFTRALASISRFTWQGNDFEAWLVTIARNLVTDHYRSPRATRETPVGVMHDQACAAGDIADQVVGDIIRRDQAHAVHQAMEALTEPQKEVLRLRFWGELAFADIARTTGRRVSATKMLKERAVRKLRHHLAAPAAAG